MSPSAGPVQSLTPESLRALLGEAYDRYTLEERRRHVEMLQRVSAARDAVVEVESRGTEGWRVTVAATDHVGLLASIAGLISASGGDIVSCDAFTLPPPQSAPKPSEPPAARAARGPAARRFRGAPGRAARATAGPGASSASSERGLILDVFDIAMREGAEGGTADGIEVSWDALPSLIQEVSALLGERRADDARERVLTLVSARPEPPSPDGAEQLYPVQVDIDNETSDEWTQLTIRSADTRGFLFEFLSALVTLDLSVARAEVRTVDGEVRDTFWVTDARGRKITDTHRLDELRVAAALIKHFTHLLGRSPDPAQALRQFGSLARSTLARPDWTSRLSDLESEDVLEVLAGMLGVSRFLWEDFLRMQQENLFPVLADAQALDGRKSRDEFREELAAACAAAGSHEEAVRLLNQYKDREMFRTDLRHITQRVGFLDFSRELADLAEAVVSVASDLAHRRLAAEHGAPQIEDGTSCGWAIAALGKFGGRELGFASDIELLFLYEGDGRTEGAKPLTNAAYHEEWVRTVRDSIAARQEGIFEIDLRLRPYGAKGALATSAAAFAAYYSESGPAQQFERLALVRLRPIAGDEALIGRFVAQRDDWVYSGAPIDVGDILHLRERQSAELVPSGQVSAKYSPGGVVDIEYFVQALQIEHGHADASIRVPGTLEAAQRLADGGYVPELFAAKLQDAYGFLRRLIDALRVDRGHAKDLTIPPSDSKAFAYLARRLYFESPDHLAQAIEVRMRFGRALWESFERLRPGSEIGFRPPTQGATRL